ncbi:MAG TPA: HDOD domain-containing protein, partial [candidate division Zixibacteria bacterium]|nr:HDOD domain-containing protein [candidate division Zixibacteria bacterium]
MTTAVQTDILSDIRDGQNLFSLPVTMYEILEALADERAGVERLAHAINRDPALTTTVLRVSNSPYYHRVSEVRNLSEAVMTIGDLSVRTIALTATILNPKHIERLSGIDPVEFVANSIAVATIAHTLAQEVGYHKPQNALTAGLIHDLGVLYFMSRHTERYREVVRACADGRNLLDVETEVFGVNHTEAGAEIARAWRLPEELITTIKAHHSGGETDVDDGLGLIVQLAVLSA